MKISLFVSPTTSPLRGTPPRAGGEPARCRCQIHDAAGTLLLPEEEYPEGGRWWEKRINY